MQDRKTLLEMILSYEDPDLLPDIRRDLEAYEWDSDEQLVVLTKENIISILERYLRSELTAKEVESWAEATDQRDDVKFGMDGDEDIIEFIGELANPIVPLAPEYAQKLIDELSR